MENRFAINLKMLRAEKGMSQSELAKKLGVTQQCVSEWEHSRTEPTMTYLWRIADIFELSIDEVCGRREWG